MTKPLLSIVIANYNYGRFLDEAIQSVIAQDMRDSVELIICDAASADNSVDVIKKYANGLPQNSSYKFWLSNSHLTTQKPQLVTWWCSEKDGGQSAAFNKGFSHASGEWLTWLNADDLLLPGTIAAFSRFVLNHPHAEWVTGNMLSFDSCTRRILQVNWGPHCQPPLLRGNRSFNAVFGPTTFWRRSLYEKVGPIDERLHYAMDTEYWARITMAGVKQYRLNHICWAFRKHSESKTTGLQTKEISERRKKEALYWMEKTRYRVQLSFFDVWYLVWVMWRFVDFSWLIREIIKIRYEGKLLDRISPSWVSSGLRKITYDKNQ